MKVKLLSSAHYIVSHDLDENDLKDGDIEMKIIYKYVFFSIYL